MGLSRNPFRLAANRLASHPTRSNLRFREREGPCNAHLYAPALPDDLDGHGAAAELPHLGGSRGGRQEHAVAIYDSTSSQLVVNRADEPVEWSRATMGSLTALRMGTVAQPILGSSGDNHRINWGYAYCAAAANQSSAA